MANTVKVRRSATPSAVPTIAQLALGEIAVNTYDGKMFIKKDVSGTQTIVEISGGGGGTITQAIAGDSGTDNVTLGTDTLTFVGGTGITSAITNNTVTFDIDSTVATLTGTQTLTNKTLTSPVISTIVNTGTLTLPTSTDTLVGRATTDTLTNKTLTSPVISDGSINNATIGATTASTGAFTSVTTPSVTATTTDLTLSAISTGAVKLNTVGGTQFQVNNTASAVNYVQVTGSVASAGPSALGGLSFTGSDTNPNFAIGTKGTGYIAFYGAATSNWQAFRINTTNARNTGNLLEVQGALAGSAPSISAISGSIGTDANIDITLIPKGTGVVAVNGGMTVSGDLTVNGTTTTINSTTITVDDINIELGSVASPTDITAAGGGITLKGTTDKTISWGSTNGWTSSEDLNVASGKIYRINGTSVLSASTLGSGVTGSSLTSVGTIGTGVWQGTLIGPTYGGTGVNNGSNTFTIGGNVTHSGAFTTTFTTTANTSVILPTTGTLATLAGTETLTNKTLTSPTLTTPALGTPASGNFSTGTFTWPTFNQSTTGNAANVTGTVAVANGGTGVTTSTGTGSVVLSASPTLTGTATLSRLTAGGRSLVGQATLNLSALDANTYYPVTIPIGQNRTVTLRIENALNSNIPTWATHGGGFSCFVEWTTNGSGWGTWAVLRTIKGYSESFATGTIIGGIVQMTQSSLEVIYLRGGGNYFFSADVDVTPTIQTASYTINGQTVAPSATVINTPTTTGSANIGAGSLNLSGLTASSAVATDASKNLVSVATTGTGSYVLSASPTFTGTIGAANLTLSGDLTVNGTTTTINSTTLSVDDKNIELGSVASPSDVTADGGGITLKGATDKTINWGATNGWTSSETFNIATGKTYKINGTDVLSATTLGSGVTGSSLTSVGTIATGVWQGTTVAVPYGGTGLTSLTAGYIPFGAGTSALGSSANLVWDNTNARLGVGTASPLQKLHLRTDTTTAGSETNILIQNLTTGTTPYYVGGLFAAAYRDVRTPAYIAGIDFYRTSAAGGLASSGEIRFYTDTVGGTQAELRTVERMRLDSSGNLGIGTTSPTQRLSVTGNVAVTETVATTGLTINGSPNAVVGAGFEIAGGASPYILSYSRASALFLGVNHRALSFTFSPSDVAANAMILNNSGNLGVGTTSPASKLHVLNTSAGEIARFMGNAAESTANGFRIEATGTTNRHLRLISGVNSTFRPYETSTGNVAVDSAIMFDAVSQNFRNSDGTIEKMRIDSAGNVGIGGTPSFRLDVQTSTAGALNSRVYNSATTGNSFSQLQLQTDAGNFYLFKNNSTNTGSAGGAGSANIYADGAYPLNFYTNAAERMRIDSTGNVGIGTTTPAYKLEVNGSFAATTKSFVIDHPTKPNMKLRYGSLEGPENGVYVRGRLTDENTIELPDYWLGLVHEDSITVSLTPIGKHQKLYVEDIIDNTVLVGNENLFGKIDCFYTVFAERKDLDKLEVEI